jgi:hypothetical protein
MAFIRRENFNSYKLNKHSRIANSAADINIMEANIDTTQKCT